MKQLTQQALKHLTHFRLNKTLKTVAISLFSFFIFWLSCIHWTNVHQVAITRNIFTGEMNIDTVPGIQISAPWVQVSRIDIRPLRVCVDCDCRNINCRLVTFKVEGWRDFVAKEGFRYYWWSNRISFNSGNKEEYRGMKNILRGYSFDSEYKFIKSEQILN